jgi:hypothetical protein
MDLTAGQRDNMTDTPKNNLMARVERAVNVNLNGAVPVAIVPASHHDIVRDEYWEYAHIVCWRRETSGTQHSPGHDGFTYGTHRVHVNSNGDSACFDGHYDAQRDAALQDMLRRAYLMTNNPKG